MPEAVIVAAGRTPIGRAMKGSLVGWRPDLPAGLSGGLMIATLACVTFGIVANNQLERAERRSFLLTLREVLRSAQLNADKDSIAALSLSDALTGLPNRRAFDSTFARLWGEWKSNGHGFAVLMVDVDYFKRYNDHYGHPAGDACLVQVGALIRQSVGRQRDLVARYGGEEFVILLAGCELAEALAIARRLCENIERAGIAHLHREDELSAVTVSAGVASTRVAATTRWEPDGGFGRSRPVAGPGDDDPTRSGQGGGSPIRPSGRRTGPPDS